MHIKAIAFAVIAFGLFATSSASAQFYSEEQLPFVKGVVVDVSDSVKDGCLPRPNELKVEAELILRRSGIKVLEEETSESHKVLITPIGSSIGGLDDLCFAALVIETYRWEWLASETLGLVLVSSNSSSHAASKPQFGQQLRTHVNTAITELANETLKARQNAQ